MKPAFNLIEEPWIPCLLPDNRTEEFGLREVLTRAHEIREIFHPSPLVATALHRLLLAILHRNFGPENLQAWKVLWQLGRFDEAVLEGYFNRWRGRFYLFHPERPFYQVPRMDEARNHPVQLLALEAAAGNNPTLFDHSFSDLPATFSPAQAACYLLARQGFSIGFGKSKPFYFSDSPLIRGYTVFVRGGNLWQTLILNIMGYNQERPIPQSGDDLPPWEQQSTPDPDPGGNHITGYINYLTWQSRKIHLIPEDEPPVVRYCQIQQNWKLPDPQPLDPFKSYRRDEKQGMLPRSLTADRAVWRDSHTLFQLGERPEILAWAGRIEGLRNSGEIEAQKVYQFSITGLATEAGKAANLILWRQERLPLPLAYLEDEELLGQLKIALDLAEKAHELLIRDLRWVAALILAPPTGGQGRKADKNEVARLVKSWAPGRLYWSRLEAPFRRLLVELPDDREEDEDGEPVYGTQRLPEWRCLVANAALESFQEVAAGLERSVRTLKAVARVEGPFRARLNKELLPGGEI